MKLRNKILAMAVVAVAGVNVYLANDAKARNSVVSLINLENVADAYECVVATEHILLYSNGTPTRITHVVCDGKRDEITCDAGFGAFGECQGVPYICTGNKIRYTVYP